MVWQETTDRAGIFEEATIYSIKSTPKATTEEECDVSSQVGVPYQ